MPRSFDIKKLFNIVMTTLMTMSINASQQENYSYFHHVKTYGNEVSSIYRDSTTGTVWLATAQGLFRYGDNTIQQSGIKMYPDALCSSLKTVQGFNNGMLLIRSTSLTYMIYDPFKNQILKKDIADYFSDWGIEGFMPRLYEVVINDNDMWLCSDKRLYSHPATLDGKASLRVIADDRIIGMHISEKYIYILTVRTLSRYDKATSKLLRTVKWNHVANTGNIRIAEDFKGNIWIGNENLYLYDMDKAHCRVICENLSVTDMTVSQSGVAYIATNTHGIVSYDYETERLNHISFDAYNVNKLKNNRLISIYVDSDNNLWISYSKQDMSISNISLDICNVNHIRALQHRNKSDDIISLLYDKTGMLWFGTDGDGLYNSAEMSYESLIPESFSKGISSDNSVISSYIDSDGRLWIGLYHRGLLCRDGQDWSLHLKGSSPYSIVEDMYGNIYAGTLGNGLYRLSPKDSFVPVSIDMGGRLYIPGLACERTGTVYVAMSNGLGIIDAATQKVELIKGNRKGTQKYNQIDLQSIYADSRGLLWIISSRSEGTVDVFDLKNDSIMTVQIHPSINISSLIEDNNKNMWIASNKGIINVIVGYDTQKDKYSFRSYIYNLRTNEDEFRHFNYRAASKSPDGNIVFGSTNGYLLINPSSYATYQSGMHHKIDFVAMEINHVMIKPGHEYGGRIILDRDIASTQSINLKSYENNLSFTVHTQDFGFPFETEYYYQLKGLTDNWIPIDDHVIDLTNLPIGSYTLAICGKNPDGTMTAPLTSINLRIDAPWYLDTWAYIFYCVIALAIITIVIYYFSERKNQNLRLQQAEKEMQRQHQINEMKLRFFTNISHDFRTPLTLIITPLEAYLNNKENNPDVKFFTPIYKNAVRLLNLINQILDFRKLEVYGASLNLSNGDIVAFIKEVCASFTMFAEGNNVELKFSSTVPTLNMAFDMDKMSKIMMNLLSNAFKHTPQGEKVFVILTANNDGMLHISVMDYGCGIPDDKKDKIFQRFYQNKCDNSANMGCGVGLHIVKEYVTLHNGTIKVSDNNPVGSVFTVSLPITHTESLPEPNHNNVISEYTSAIKDDKESHEPQTIMFVEDNEEFLDFLCQSFSNENYRVLRATNGEEVLRLLEGTSVDIIVSDVMMDRMDGLELCRRIKSNLNYCHIPVILLTAKSMVEDEITGFEVGADDYITKPFNLSVLKLRIQNILKSRELYRRNFKNKVDVNPSEITVTSLDEQFISQALSIVEENIANTDFSVEDLSKALGIHRAHLHRKLSGITGKSPIEFIRLIRLKRAKQYLSKSQLYISEIAYSVGFNSPKLFAKYFKDEFGMSSREYQNSNNSENDLSKHEGSYP